MKKKQMLLALALLATPYGYAQTVDTQKTTSEDDITKDNSSFTFTESQLGEDDDMTADVIQVNSASNVYTSNIGYTWSPVRFKFRAYDSRYNDVYMNGVQVNNSENGRFNFSTIGGMNDATRNQDAANPFEDNNYGFMGIGGSSNYNFRASQMAAGNKVTLSGCNRNYTLRGMYTYGTGLTKKGWAFFGTVGYRWANMQTAAVQGTFYNSLSYFLSLQKVFNEKHSLNLATWGSPTERAQQGASTDEAYWLANDYQYNPYWGYQGGKKRASRVVNNYEPSALLTWDFQINDRMKLTTSAFFKYVWYSSTKLNYSGTNPAPDYWKSFPSYNYNVWGNDPDKALDYDLDAWQESYNYWTASKANRQINFDNLYFANQQLNRTGSDAIYWIEARHNDHLTTNLGSTFDWNVDSKTKVRLGLQLASNRGSHYETMEDLLGGEYFHNTNTYLVGDYSRTDKTTEYDVDKGYQSIKVGDRMRYDYFLWNQDLKFWGGISKDWGISHSFLTARIGGRQMWRDGHMRNGLFQDNSKGKSGTARFLDGGFKVGSTLNMGKGHALTFGMGYEAKAPNANVSFVSPEMNNDFVTNLKNEKDLTAELTYSINNQWLQLSLTGYFTHIYEGTEWQQFYNDDANSFTYNSLTGVEKDYYGVELGAKFKITSNFDIRLLGTYSDNKYTKNTDVTWMNSTSGSYTTDICYNKGMRESGTPLAAASLSLNYKINGWYLSLIGNYYDRIYLSYSPNMRYYANLKNAGRVTSDPQQAGQEIINVPEQAKGDGGFMLDASIGKQFYIGHHPLSVNLMLVNICNNRGITTGGYEQSRSNYSYSESTGTTTQRTYNFEKNPKKFYAQGINGMLNINYRF